MKEGIYRVPGAKLEVDRLKSKLDTDPHCINIDFDGFNVNAVAAAFKDFLRKLPVPLLPYDVRQLHNLDHFYQSFSSIPIFFASWQTTKLGVAMIDTENWLEFWKSSQSTIDRQLRKFSFTWLLWRENRKKIEWTHRPWPLSSRHVSSGTFGRNCRVYSNSRELRCTFPALRMRDAVDVCVNISMDPTVGPLDDANANNNCPGFEHSSKHLRSWQELP